MAVTAYTGPLITFGITQTSTGQTMEYNEERGPSLNDLGQGYMDPRPFYRYRPGGAVGISVLSHFDNCAYVDYVPFTANASAIAVAATNAPSAGGAITVLGAGSSVGAINTTIVAPESGLNVSVVAIDSTANYIIYGSGTVNAWNPQAGTGRTISITTSSSGDGGTVSVAGRDMYGFKMTESIVLSTASPAIGSSNAAGYKFSGKKAFKYISSVSASTTLTSTGWSVGFNDTFGFPLALPYCGYNSIVNLFPTSFSSVASVLLSSASTTLLSTPATQTSTTPDVRGTYASTTASNGTLRLQIYQGIDAFMTGNITVANTSSLYGGTQFSSV